MTEIKKPCYEDLDAICECLEDGDRKCFHLGPPTNGTWENCEQGKLSPYYRPAVSCQRNTEEICDKATWDNCPWGGNKHQPPTPSKIEKPCCEDYPQIEECEWGTYCFATGWDNCSYGKLFGSGPSQVALLERITMAQERQVAAWESLKESEKKRVEYARNAEAIRQHTAEKETEQWQARNAFLDARVDAQHQAWVDAEKARMEWNARAAERGEREVAAFEKMVDLLEYLCDRKRDFE